MMFCQGVFIFSSSCFLLWCMHIYYIYMLQCPCESALNSGHSYALPICMDMDHLFWLFATKNLLLFRQWKAVHIYRVGFSFVFFILPIGLSRIYSYALPPSLLSPLCLYCSSTWSSPKMLWIHQKKTKFTIMDL